MLYSPFAREEFIDIWSIFKSNKKVQYMTTLLQYYLQTDLDMHLYKYFTKLKISDYFVR